MFKKQQILNKKSEIKFVYSKRMSPARFELTASELGILRSIQLSYEDKNMKFVKNCHFNHKGQNGD